MIWHDECYMINALLSTSTRVISEDEMLVLTRRPNEGFELDGGITIVISEVKGKKVRLSIEAPKEVTIRRLDR